MSEKPPVPPPPGSPRAPGAPEAAPGRSPAPAAGPAAAATAVPTAGGEADAPLFRLLPLDCPSCGAPIGAEGEDVVYYCTACRSGYRLAGAGAEGGAGGGAGAGAGGGSGLETLTGSAAGADGGGGGILAPAEALTPVEVAFVALPDRAAGRYLPFWLLPARVEIRDRRAAGGSFRGLVNFFLGGDEEHPPGEGTFAIPAYDTPLAHATALARRYTEAFPRLGERLGEKLTGGRLSAEDAKKLAHFTLIASEAEKPDTLQNLDYRIDFGSPRLLGVPFVETGGRWVDALFGLPG